jgi:molybdopterin/thiamine biosynthesis adenylyltransferase
MKAAGWTYERQKNKIIYKKDGIEISDNRLGNRYIERGILEDIERQNEKIRERKANEQMHKASYELARKDVPNISLTYIPHKSKSGKRIPQIFRFLEFMKRLLEKIGNTFLSEDLSELAANNLAFAKAEAKIEALNEAEKIAEKYQITDEKVLDERIKIAGMNGKIKDHQASKLYDNIDSMSQYMKDLKMYDDLKTVMDSLGIDDAEFSLTPVSPYEVRKNLAALDHADGKTKKRLFNKISASGYALTDYTLLTITQTESDQIEKFLSGRIAEKPELLMTPEEAQRASALEKIENMLERNHRIQADKYRNISLSEGQLSALKKSYPNGVKNVEFEKLNKHEASRLLSLSAKTAPVPEYVTNDDKAASDYMCRCINNLKVVCPELLNIDENRLTVKSANDIVSYYSARFDHYEADKKIKSIHYSDYPSEIQEIIRTYKNILDITTRYGLDTSEKVHGFIKKYDEITDRADDLSKEARQFSNEYKDLLHLKRILKNAESKSFIYGPLFNGNTDQTDRFIADYKNDAVDCLNRIASDLKEQIRYLSSLSSPNDETKMSGNYVPIEIDTLLLLQNLKEYFPDYFTEEITDLSSLTTAEALRILKNIDQDHTVNIRLEQETQKENTEDHVKENAEEIIITLSEKSDKDERKHRRMQ